MDQRTSRESALCFAESSTRFSLIFSANVVQNQEKAGKRGLVKKDNLEVGDYVPKHCRWNGQKWRGRQVFLDKDLTVEKPANKVALLDIKKDSSGHSQGNKSKCRNRQYQRRRKLDVF